MEHAEVNDMQTIIRLITAIRKAENAPVWSPFFVSEEVIKAPARDRDILAVKLQKAGLIEGLRLADSPRNEVIWSISEPETPLAGIEWMEKNNERRQNNG